jgi:hypothetical protein
MNRKDTSYFFRINIIVAEVTSPTQRAVDKISGLYQTYASIPNILKNLNIQVSQIGLISLSTGTSGGLL